jgi:hypothetical protein
MTEEVQKPKAVVECVSYSRDSRFEISCEASCRKFFVVFLSPYLKQAGTASFHIFPINHSQEF